MPIRWSALLRVALCAVALQLYYAPLRVLEQELGCYPRCDRTSVVATDGRAEPQAQFQDVMFLRMWLTFAVTLYALCGVISKQVVLGTNCDRRTDSATLPVLFPLPYTVSLLHAMIHFARSISDAPPIVASPSSSLLDLLYYWQESSVESCVYEYGALLLFALLLRYVLFPPASALATFQRHSRNLKKFFAQHDKQFVPLVDRLLEEYTGHERLLYARIRRLYNNQKTTTNPSAHLQTP